MYDALPARTFRDLKVWQRSHQLTLRVYALTATFPRHEIFGLAAQMRRSAVSVPSNIAEGFARRGRRDKARVLNIASASLEELRYQLILAADLGYLPKDSLASDAAEVSRMLSSYERTILASAHA